MALKKLSVASFAEQIIGDSRARLISVPMVVSGIRERLPDCEHTDQELAQIVSMIALSKGRNLSFMPPRGIGLAD